MGAVIPRNAMAVRAVDFRLEAGAKVSCLEAFSATGSGLSRASRAATSP